MRTRSTIIPPFLRAREHSPGLVAVMLTGFVLGVTSQTQANMVTNPSFETPEPTFIFGFPGVPSTFGDWGGDLSEIVTAESGVSPFDGDHMLRFDATGNSADPLLTAAQIYQTIDVSGYSAEIAQGIAQADVSAFFNRVTGDAQTDTSFAVHVYAFAGEPGSLLTQLINSTYLDVAGGGVGTDGDPLTWEIASASLLLPTGTDFLAARLTASENVFNDGSHPEFDGHYVDMVSAEMVIIPEPATLLLLAVGSLGLIRRRRSIA
jgi:hypothetical protein